MFLEGSACKAHDLGPKARFSESRSIEMGKLYGAVDVSLALSSSNSTLRCTPRQLMAAGVVAAAAVGNRSCVSCGQRLQPFRLCFLNSPYASWTFDMLGLVCILDSVSRWLASM